MCGGVLGQVQDEQWFDGDYEGQEQFGQCDDEEGDVEKEDGFDGEDVVGQQQVQFEYVCFFYDVGYLGVGVVVEFVEQCIG